MKKCFAKTELFNYDFMTQAANKYPNIPAGTEVVYEGQINNFYGRYTKVRWFGILYYVDPKDIEFRGE